MRFPLLPVLTIALCVTGCSPQAPTSEEPASAKDSTRTVVQDGTREIPVPDGGRMVGDVAAGKRNGEWTSYFASGTVRSRATYANGLREGPSSVYHENGMLFYKGQYHNDQQVGDWLFFDDQGTQLKIARYDSLGTLLEQK